MKLASFHIKECFGFRDSERIDLQDPTNLIYVLGRNSSGKTSFLTALAYFSPHFAEPKSYANFTNFDPSGQQPSLLAEYTIEASDLNLETFIETFRIEIDRLNQGFNITLLSKEYQRYKDELTKRLLMLYTVLFEESIHKGRYWVKRDAAGNYCFSEKSDFKDAVERDEKFSAIVQSVPQQLGLQMNANGQLNLNGSWQPFTQMAAAQIENLLAKQLPVITWFKAAYALLDVLPNVIKIEHLTTSPNRLTTALIEYLGKAKLDRLLKGQYPRELREILNELQEKIDVLTKAVNESREPGTALLAIDLYPADGGLQVTMMADGKSSFYRHLSDNTK